MSKIFCALIIFLTLGCFVFSAATLASSENTETETESSESAKFLLPKKKDKPDEYYLAVIIDDFGNGSDGTEEFLNLSVPYTAAVMPAMPYSAKEAKILSERSIDVILHMPMQPHTGKASWLGRNAITTDLSDEEASNRIKSSLEEIDCAVGINNHMGSKIMESEHFISLLFDVIKDEDLFFVDSMTTAKSVATRLGEEKGVTVIKRDVFLDGTKDVSVIKKNLLKAASIAKKRGYAVAIGHVGQEGGKPTANAIRDLAPELEKQGIRFVGIREYKKKVLDN